MQIFLCRHLFPLCISSKGEQDPAAGKSKLCSQSGIATRLKILVPQQAVRIMKLTAIILLTACLQVSAKGYSQKITLSVTDVPLEQVFTSIEKQSDYSFNYFHELIKQAHLVTIQVKDASLEEVLAVCFKEQPFTYVIINKLIILKEKKQAINGLQQKAISPDPIEIRGVITDENGAPAQGVNVMVKGTNKGTTSNLKGEFVLRDVNESAVLIISSVGYDMQEISVKNKTFISTQLKVAVGNLDALQVVAYGTTSRRFQTGNVATVKATDIEKQPVNNLLLALQGRVPGLNIVQNSGYAGSGVAVNIQGISSIATKVGNDPLYVVDGVPYPSRMLITLRNIQGSSGQSAPDQAGFGAGAGSPLSFINPADIESIDVLKDADATAIYGSRAASGAIIITTKKGKGGKSIVDLNMQSGWGKMTRRLDVLNTEQFLEMRKEAFKNDGLPLPSTPATNNYDLTVYDQDKYTDWQKVLLGGTAHYNNVHASLSDGNANTQILVGAGYYKETTVLPGDLANTKGSAHFSLNNTSINQKFRFQMSGSYLVYNNKIIDRDLTQDAISLAPNSPDLYNADGSLNWMRLPNGNVTWFNPLAYLLKQYNQKTNNLISSAEISYQLLPGLDIKSSFGYTNMQTREELLIPLTSYRPDRWSTSQRNSTFNNNNINSWIIEPQFSYKRGLLNGKLEGLIGATINQNNSNLEILQGSGYNSDLDLRNIAAAPTTNAGRGVSVYKYNALFARIKYNWQDKYILNITARRDGSSRFGAENQFNNFGSIGFAWLFSNEPLIKHNVPFLSFGKLRASYGTTGNDQIGDYRFLSLYNVFAVPTPYQGAVGVLPNNLPNPFLQWEETKKLNVGLDLAFLNNRILVNANYYRNRTSNELLSYNLPITAGFNSIANNFPATVQNYGWELSVNTININNQDFKWSTAINLTIPKNKLVEFTGLETSSYANNLVIGQPITIAKLFHLIGVDATTGTYQFGDKDGRPTSSPNSLTDRTVLADPAPKFYGGFQNTFSYKGFELDFLFQYYNQKAFNVFYGMTQLPGQYFGANNASNQPNTVLQRWQKPGDNQPVQRFTTSFNYITSFINVGSSDAAFSDATYLRLKNASLSWQVPQPWIKKVRLQGAKIYVLGQNLLTKTNYVGLDPETRSSIALPPLRVITCGINVSL
jgi:TonB-linked SusC/RagA family outer membrane protein